MLSFTFASLCASLTVAGWIHFVLDFDPVFLDGNLLSLKTTKYFFEKVEICSLVNKSTHFNALPTFSVF